MIPGWDRLLPWDEMEQYNPRFDEDTLDPDTRQQWPYFWQGSSVNDALLATILSVAVFNTIDYFFMERYRKGLRDAFTSSANNKAKTLYRNKGLRSQ